MLPKSDCRVQSDPAKLNDLGPNLGNEDHSLKVCLLAFFLVLGGTALAGPLVTPPETIVENYCAATHGQEQSLRNVSMDVEIEASLPKLKKQGRLAFRDGTEAAFACCALRDGVNQNLARPLQCRVTG